MAISLLIFIRYKKLYKKIFKKFEEKLTDFAL